ncbi:unnamed protein product [Hermetia illucens]|uniref:Transcription factor grauzone n=1 Tax=Hermetia illucens TaxID=343691 RepID=A0A7R8UCB8_HERIL|nr:transcription factor grauzone-like [Hermetia illucens]CAD7078146.1 unnamed protein product [Hermetia illucens]
MTSGALCRMCVEEAEPLIDIFGDFGREQQIGQIVAQHFWFEVREDDPLSDKMCTDCWSKLVEFHSFYYQVQKAQDRVTMVVLEDQKEDLVQLQDGLRSRIIITNGGDVGVLGNFNTQFDYEEDVKSESGQDEEYDDIASTGNLPHPLSTESETIVQIQMIPQIKNVVDINLSTELEESIELSPADEMNDNSTPLSEIADSAVEISNPPGNTIPDSPPELALSRSTVTKPYHRKRSKKCTRSEENIAGSDYSCLDKCPTKKRSIKSRLKQGITSVRKENNEEQKEREIELIESYYRMQCDLCHEDFGKFQELFDHYLEIHQFRGFIVCCGRKFFRRPVIAEHVLWHTQPEDFTCATCETIFANKRSYDNHMLVHAPPDVQLYQCEHCPKTFTKKFKLDKHKLSHLTDEEKQYICDECHKPYASDALLRAHKRVVHRHTYAHMCEICARVFKSRVFFEKHQLEHLGQNLPKVQCPICEAWMKNEHTMRAHMRNHQDEGQEHQCDICGKKGPSRNAIAKHKRFVHLSERKFKCTLCDKAFKRAITLKEHMTVHTGEVLYTCTFCPKTFNSGANMHAHRKKAHPTEWFEEKQSKLELMKPGEANL